MKLRLIRRIAVALVAFYAFGQANVALAVCGMDRGAMAQAMSMQGGGDQGCEDCAKAGQDTVAVTAACAVHCTADLQLTKAAPDSVPVPAVLAATTLLVPRFRSPPVLAYLPPGNLPRRILLHSFQV